MTTKSIQLRGIPTLITVDRRSSKPLYRQIYDSVRGRIVARELRAGQVVPSTRAVARDLRISRIPVLNAYAQLHAEGYLEARVGAGTFIAGSLPGESTSPAVVASSSLVRRPISRRAASLPRYELPTWLRLGPFQLGQPDVHRFPVDVWAKIVARHSRRMSARSLQYGDVMGLPELREAIATYLRTSRAVRCEADQIMVVSGSQQALDLCARVLLDPTAAAWTEEPGYWLVQHAVKAAEGSAVPVPVDNEGLNVATGMKLKRNARVAFVAPSHQNPLGVTMSATRRLQILDWAHRAGAWIVEDDYDSEYRYDSMPVASLQGLDAHGCVVYIGTFSKVMFPSLRLGYIVIPPDLVERFSAFRRAMDLCPAYITQAGMAEFIREGYFARHVRRMRPIYAERRRLLVEELEQELGDRITISGAPAGMHICIFVDDSIDDRQLAAAAFEQQLLLSPLSALYAGPPLRRGFVLGFGNTETNRITPAVRHLKKLLLNANK